MIEKKTTPKRKIIQRVLIGGVSLGVIATVLRMVVTFLGVLAIPSVVGNDLPRQSSNEFLANLTVLITTLAPYLIGLGAMAIFLQIIIFSDKEGRLTLIFWGILMTLYFLCLLFIPGI